MFFLRKIRTKRPPCIYNKKVISNYENVGAFRMGYKTEKERFARKIKKKKKTILSLLLSCLEMANSSYYKKYECHTQKSRTGHLMFESCLKKDFFTMKKKLRNTSIINTKRECFKWLPAENQNTKNIIDYSSKYLLYSLC